MRADGSDAGAAILGISCDYHDAAAAVVVDGQIVAAAEEERFTRVKHDASLPVHAVAACLSEAGITASDLDHVVFYEKPLVIASRFLATRRRQGPTGLGAFLRGTPDLLGGNLMIGPRVARMLRRLGASTPPPLQFVEHHRSHAAAAFLPSPFEHAAILTIDGLGEWASATIGHGSHHRLEILEEQRFPNSLGLLYSFITAYCGFTPNDDEYKVMGLAPYGEDRFDEALTELATLGEDGSLRVDARAVGWFGPRGLRRPHLRDLFDGPPRDPADPITQREADLAASLQRFIERSILAMARRAHELTGSSRLCLAGGVALNSVANGRLLREGPFDELWIQPAAGDAGSAIGAALALWHDHLSQPRATPRVDLMRGALLGPAVPVAAIDAALASAELPHRIVEDPTELAAEVADRLAAGDVVGWFHGSMEFGPRALEHRSILADPRSSTVRSRINLAVKGRESFRPFAPAVLAEHAAEWFDLDHPSPYMLLVAQVRADRLVEVGEEPTSLEERAGVVRSQIPACTHVDGSARIQTVTEDAAPEFHRLLRAFHERTGCPILLNTSFNRAGEPIVASPAEAIATASAGRLDLLVLGHALVEGAALQAASEREVDPAGSAAVPA